jgi:hypothetical protein
VQHQQLRPSENIDQNDIQEVQDDFCKFLMQEVLKPGGLFFDRDSKYATHLKIESLCAACENPFLSFFWQKHH